MSFKNFLTESKKSHYNDISQEEMIALTNKNVSDSSKFDIYRGSYYWDNNKSYIIDTSKTTRKSANTYNYYTIVIDKILGEKGYPLRSKSIICSNNKEVSSNFGTLKVIIPFDDALIGIVPEEDIWYVNLSEVDRVTFEDFANCLGSYDISVNSYDEIVNGIIKIINDYDEFLKSECKTDFKKLFNNIDGNYDAVDKRLREVFDLDKMGFKFATGKTYRKQSTKNEIWISGKSIAKAI